MPALTRRIGNAALRELQRLWARFGPAEGPRPLKPSQAALIATVFDWVRQYLSRPHPQLGREGAVCPFAQTALEADQLSVSISEDDGRSRRRLRATLLQSAAVFAARLRERSPSMYASMVVAFPRLRPDCFHLLDELHDELKNGLMTSDIMVSPFHPKSERPAIWNPEFRVLRAPFAGFAFRRMDVRDIVFVGHNRQAFAHYRARFEPRFARDEISDEHGYATAFAQALSRFGSG
jgi:heptaprenyl diphosphate synthase